MNRPDPLTPEERALARLLGRPGTSAPPAAVDEAVLAAARAAETPVAPVAPKGTAGAVPNVASDGPQGARQDGGHNVGRPTHPHDRTHRRRSRVPTILGVAASVVFAVGIAWQLKFDDPGTTPPPEAAPVASNAAADAAADPSSQKQAVQQQVAEAPAVEKREAEAPAVAERPAARAIAPAPPPPPAPYAAAPPAPLMAEEAPAPAAAASAAPVPQERAELDRVVVTGTRIAQEPADSARTAPPTAALRAQRAAPAAAKAVPSPAQDALPGNEAIAAAVEADALLPRRQWIQRIRERRDAGDHDTARASLERYLQHYPEVRVPRDLRALLEN